MSPNAAADQDAYYHLYLKGEWAGPFQVGQIRSEVAEGRVAIDSFAYDATRQRHFTVEELLAAPAPAAVSESGSESGSITHGMPAMFDDVVDMAPQSSASFEAVLPDLKAFYAAYLGLSEHTAEPQQALKDLHAAHQGLIQEIDHRRSDGKALARVINEIDEVADYLANRHQLSQLWSLLSELEKVDLAAAPDEAVTSARAVLACLVERAEAQVGQGSSADSSSVLLDLAGLDDEADSVITRKILLSARSEVASTKRDMDVLQQTYNELQEQHAKDLDKARRLLEKAESARAEERHTARQTAAEVRNLAAEIQRLASEADIAGGDDQDLVQEVGRLGEELRTADASTLAYMAEDVLIRMVAQLRQRAAGGSGDSAPLRSELAHARESLVLAQGQVAQLTGERDALRLQYEQSCLAAEKASERAKDREHRLRSTVTALEVTKELHQEVMDDLKVQLQGAQGRVEQMERDLASVRGEMKDSSGTVEARGKAIQHEMQRMVEMKALLEVRSSELSANLKSAEDELAKAQSSDQDASLAEALAAKVTQLRSTFETTTNRLKDQEAIAGRLTQELEASRSEAQELRGRSDQLSTELGDARGSLHAAKHRLDELQQAYARLEAERESLHTELHHRKSTDIIHKQGAVDADPHQSERIARLEHDSAALGRQLASEKRQSEQMAQARLGLESRIAELTSERNELQRKVEFLQSEHFNDHARHTAAIAVSTQAAIESERRLRDLQNRVVDLEAQLRSSRKSSEIDGLEPTTARVAGHSNALENADQQGLRAELEQVARERDQVLAELETIRTTSTGPRPALEVPEAVARRLVELERELTAATASIAALDERHAQAASERDRLKRDFERLRNERESAAVEHRTALKSARDRLTESQERVAGLERELTARAAGDSDGLALRAHLDHSLVERERLNKEVQRLAGELARVNASVPVDRDQQLIGLAKASQQLASEQERVLVLNRGLMETLQLADSARARTLELQGQLDLRTGERDRLQQQLDRQAADLADLRLGMGVGLVPDEIRSGIARRDQALGELEQVRRELAEARAQLTTAQRADHTVAGIDHERARIRDLEQELNQLRSESDQRQQMFNEARARLVQVSSERDRLAAELAELKGRPDQEVELKMLRRRLIRAKKQIKRLRRERDAAIAERARDATNLHELTGQIDRLKSAQRAAAEALGVAPSTLPMAGGAGESSHGSRVAAGLGSGGFSTRDLSSVQRAAETPPGRLPPKALTRRIMPTQTPRPPGLGFTSAFGRPMIPAHSGIAHSAGMDSAPNMTSQTHVTSVLQVKSHAQPPWHRGLVRQPLTIAAFGFFALGAGALFLLPPLIPLTSQGVVNAPVTAVNATIAGQFNAVTFSAGMPVERGQVVGVINNDHVDTSTLKGLVSHRDSTRGKRAETIELIAETERTIATLNGQVDLYRAGLITDLEAHIQGERIELAKRDSALGLTADKTVLPGAMAAVESQRALIDTLGRRLARLRAGQFDADDLPVAQTRVDEANARLATLGQQRRAFDLAIGELDTAITAEEANVAALTRSVVTAAVPGVMWSRKAGDHQAVEAGAELLRIADPQTIEVEALLPERYRFDVPMDAIIEVIAGGDRRVRGTLSQAIEQGSHTKPSRATSLTAPANGYDKLYIVLDPTAAPLPIGQKVSVVVLGQRPGWFTRSLAWFYEKTRL